MLQAINLEYGIRDKKLISGITLDFLPGSIYGILGPNGAGKTTLLKTLSGIWNPTAGKVLWNGLDLLQNERQLISKTISLVAHNGLMPFDFSVLEIVAMGRYPHGSLSKAHAKHEIVEWALTMVDAWHLKDQNINQISNGERQRVYIARALVTESAILLLDEPASSLDIRHQLEIWILMQSLAKSGKVIIVANHDLASTERFCDQIAILNQGRCIAKGRYNQALTPQLLDDVFGVKEGPQSFVRELQIAIKK